ncbi:OmpA family protein [Enterovibrio coralii]|uniref:Flagellar motor protein MotB n=1 Tax=Enterovibrio coralii TaxID=294935 RepID=A0A135ID80_9GAMM|nr:OmpA family protein [Enterovibrio coralii]KXF83423.1 flagellar motor protein MotB [Enterovibrio coralii]
MTMAHQISKVCTSALILSSLLLSMSLQASDLFSPLPDGEESQEGSRHYTRIPVIIGSENGKLVTEEVGGRLNRYAYKLPPSYEPFNLVNSYRSQINMLGGEILFSCEGKKNCGSPRKAIWPIIQPIDTISKKDPVIVVAKIPSPTKPVIVTIYSSRWKNGTGLQVDVLEEIPEPLDLVVADAGYLNTAPEVMKFEDLSHKDIKNSADHPMLQRLPGAWIQYYIQHGYGETVLLTGFDKQKPIITKQEGKVTDIGYHLPRQYSEYEVFANYHAALTKLGFKPSFRCKGEEACGKKRTFTQTIKALVSTGADESQHYGLYKLERPEGDVYAMVYVIGFSGGLLSELRIVEETNLIDDRVVIDLEGLTDKMAQEGHVALDGLLFEFDSDKMLPEAKPVLDILATYLKGQPNRAFFVVGHTDDKGTQSYNQKLAEKRASAVVRTLVQDYQIPKSQLEANGVGEYAPVANNLSEDGQKQNRRVELVLRSDKK